MWYMDKAYMKKHLQTYIEFQLQQGYELIDIRHALLKYGYNEKLLDEITDGIDVEVLRPLKKPSIKELNEDLYVYVQNLLVDYIKREQVNGYELDVIEKALVNYGHHPSTIKSAMKAVKQGLFVDQQPTIKLPAGLVLTLVIAGVLGFILFLASATDASIGRIVYAFSPAIAGIVVVYIVFLMHHDKKTAQLLPIAGVLIAILGFIALLKSSPTLASLSEPQTVILLNALVAFVPSVMICLLSKAPPRVFTVKEMKAEAHKVDPNVDAAQPAAAKNQSS